MASNILIVVDIGYTGIHHSKYWMPIHYMYDTLTDGQNKKQKKLSSFSKQLVHQKITHRLIVLYIMDDTHLQNDVKW